jgi:thiosulfate/3-mercaptopyruvate sulfurtransferase
MRDVSPTNLQSAPYESQPPLASRGCGPLTSLLSILPISKLVSGGDVAISPAPDTTQFRNLSLTRSLMHSPWIVATSIVGLILAPSAARAQAAPSSRDAMLVTPSWVAAHLGDANLVLLHVGDQDKYAAAHLPGARLVDLGDISVSGNGLTLEMPAAGALRTALANLGISDNSRIIIYSANGRSSPATRVALTLDYAGLGSRTSVMDGGLEAWQREKRATTDVIPPAARPGKLSPLSLEPIIVDASYVRAHAAKPGVAVVDARAAAFYDGMRSGGSPMRAGHIPGARSIPFTEVNDAEGKLKPAGQLLAVFKNAGVQPGDTVVGYCHIGQQATAVLFAAKSLGHPVLLYDGSFEDWSRHTDFPVENPSAKKP